MRTEKFGDSVLSAVGNTPLVALDRLAKGLPGRVLAKLEYVNPGHSVKDRPALRIIEDARKSGALKPAQTVIERTSGNMGTGLAICCAVLGYPLVVVMSVGNSMERVRMLRALGAKVVRVPQVDGAPGQVTSKDLQKVERETIKLQNKLKAFRADQFTSPSVVKSHYEGTGAEIWDQTGGKIDTYVGVAGSSGTFTGAVKYLKERNRNLRAFTVEPKNAAILSGKVKSPGRHKLQGVGYAEVPQLWDRAMVDGFVQVTDKEATETARNLAKREGIFCGYTSGANVAAALQLARKAKKGEVIVTVICDSGLKYLSTDLFK
ncbi:MAG: cysteine synthase family protein [Planctomycetes bacterium]|nr:cysteine synthase family protein [Planctomycetota bacterium]